MKNLFKALAAFQQEVEVIHKGTQGYGYSYADLPTIFPVINPLLQKHGLGFTQEIVGTTLKTTIFHVESGEFRESAADIPQNVSLKGMNDFQVLGSAITYIRRYALSSALGLVTDKDTDAGGQQTTAAPKQNTQAVNPKLLQEVSQQLANAKTIEDLLELGKERKKDIAASPAIKAMFTNRKTQLNGNA